MGRTKREQFTDDEYQVIFRQQSPLTALWDLQSIMSDSHDKDAKEFGLMVREELPPLIDRLEASMEKANEAQKAFDLKAAGDLICRICDISEEIGAIGQLFSRWNEEEGVRFDYDESNGMFHFLTRMAKEVREAGEEINNL